jgi:dolichol kinase
MVPAGREVTDGISVRRKLFHLTIGTIFILSMLAFEELKWFFLSVLSFGIVLSFVQEKFPLPIITWFLDRYDKLDDSVPGQGPLTFFLGAVLVWFLFPENVAVSGVIVLTFGDPFAYLGGKLFGRTELPWNRKKTLAGLISFMLVPFILLTLLFDPITAIVVSLAGALIESVEWPHKVLLDDNVVIPVLSSVILFIFSFLLAL